MSRRVAYLIGLPDHDLCDEDHRTARIPGNWPCGRFEINAFGEPVSCRNPGEWARKPRRGPLRRGCTWHVAAEIRIEHLLYRQQLETGKP